MAIANVCFADVDLVGADRLAAITSTSVSHLGVTSIDQQTGLPLPPLEQPDAPTSIELYTFLHQNPGRAGRGMARRTFKQIAAFYKKNNYTPIWLDNGQWNDVARAIIERLKRANYDGLNPDNYKIDDFSQVATRQSMVRLPDSSSAVGFEKITREIALSKAVVKYANHAYSGRVVPGTISNSIEVKTSRLSPLKILDKVSSANNPVKSLEDYNPQHRGFIALRQKLAAIIDKPPKTPKQPSIAKGKTLKVGMRDDRVVLIRNLLGLTKSSTSTNVYDQAMETAIRQFQKENSLTVDGIIGRRTLLALNGGPQISAGDLISNMEIWRWLPHNLGDRYVLVNTPGFRLRVFEAGIERYSTKIIVGKKNNKTPLLSDEIEYVVVNPFWNVPRSIMTKEIVPKARRNPNYLARNNFDVLARINGKIRVVSPFAIDWARVNANTPIRLRQKPGKRNSLGRIKFMFPNRHSVYLHDTPNKLLFKSYNRAFSHGCVRVENPLEFAGVLFDNDSQWNSERLKRLIGSSERTVPLKKAISIHLAYFTVYVDDKGKVFKLPDIYGYNKLLLLKLKL